MQLGIIGLPKSGKTTLFNTLTASQQETDKFSRSQRTNVGVATIGDARLEKLRDLYRPRRYVPATTELVDIPGMEAGHGGADLLDLPRLKEVDGLVHVVRAFEDPEILHPDGSVDPARDVAAVDLELIVADHQLVERRLERLAQATKRGLSEDETRERALLADEILPALEAERPLRSLHLAPEAERRLRGFQLLSAKQMLVVLNVGEEQVAGGKPATYGLASTEHVELIVVSAPIEEEISRLEPEEQAVFLHDLGLDEASAVRLARASYRLLGVISFFTVGEDEVRAWTIPCGTRAREAAGVIHSDMERGFIRAEVVDCENLLTLGSLAACRDQGRLRLEGKDYVVRDGDVMHVRFNV